MRSMTGFGEGRAENDRFRAQVTLRSVNHRQLDINLRMRDPARASERSLRDLIRESLHRGRIDVSIEIEALAPTETRVTLREDLVEELGRVVTRLEALPWVEPGVRIGELLRVPELLVVETQPTAWSSEDESILLGAAGQALGQLIEMRQTEGQSLENALAEGLARIRGQVGELASRRRAVAEATLDSLRTRLEGILADALAEGALDSARLAQEAAILVEKSDIQEELDRLASHLDQVESTLASQGAIGRRLDFLSQELSRELNTIGAKCRDPEMMQVALDGKLQCEQLREQIQNVE